MEIEYIPEAELLPASVTEDLYGEIVWSKEEGGVGTLTLGESIYRVMLGIHNVQEPDFAYSPDDPYIPHMGMSLQKVGPVPRTEIVYSSLDSMGQLPAYEMFRECWSSYSV